VKKDEPQGVYQRYEIIINAFTGAFERVAAVEYVGGASD
jgi:hypothetical protein